MIVYRVEHVISGIGPHDATLDLPIDHDDSDQKPWPGPVSMPVRFGFSSLRQAGRWFTKAERKVLRSRGFVIVKLSVPRAEIKYRDRAQVAFRPDGATLVKVTRPSNEACAQLFP